MRDQISSGIPLASSDEAGALRRRQIRLAVVVSHPIQYYAPLYQRLARRDDIAIKVFFTWHAGERAVEDSGFQQPIAWDIPLTEGYEYELVRNTASEPGTHHYLGLRNPSLPARVEAWNPDAVHLTGWAWHSHLRAMWHFHKRGTPILFRGDSHLLDHSDSRPRWWIKRAVLHKVYSWPALFLAVGSANRAYYGAFGVQSHRICPCPHSIDVKRFAEPGETYEREAARWRRQLGIAENSCVLLFAGKFEPKKRPLDLIRAVSSLDDDNVVLLMIGGGELEREVRNLAASDPKRIRVLPFQNQSRMPVVYRLGDIFVLPSAYGETWGMAVNEALACGRPVLVSDRVGCSADVVDPGCGVIFNSQDPTALAHSLRGMVRARSSLRAMRSNAQAGARMFDISQTEVALIAGLALVFPK